MSNCKYFLVFFYLSAFFSIKAQMGISTLPLSTHGCDIVDRLGKKVHLKGVNWWGMNGSQIPYSDDHAKGINTHSMPFGLHVQHLDTIINSIVMAGFNSVRLPFSNQMLHDTIIMRADWCGPNVHLLGKTPLEVLDIVVKAITEKGIFVLLNNHSTTTHWCCNYDFNGLWYGKNDTYSQTTKDWISDWEMLAQRYASNEYVIGADLRNEVRPMRMRRLPLPINPKWGGGGKNDWHKAATQAGNTIHKVAPHWLIVVEGINAQVMGLSQLRFPHLKPVKRKPIVLNIPQKLVYEVHNYSFSWVRANLLLKRRQIRYIDLSSEDRFNSYWKNWGFLLNPSALEGVPVLLGEFGCSAIGQEAEAWLSDLTRFVHDHNMGFFWWTLEEELDNLGSYGIMNSNLNQINLIEDWRGKYLIPLLSPIPNP